MMAFDCFNLREMQYADLARVLDWRNSDRVRGNMFNDQLISWDEHVRWFEHMQQRKSSHHLVLDYKDSSIGVMNFTQLDIPNAKCTWGFYLGEVGSPPLSGTVLGYLGLTYAFEHLHIRKLCAEVFGFNERSVLFHNKLGFEEEGILRQHIYRNNSYQDVRCFAMFNDQWITAKRAIELQLRSVY